MLPEDLDFELAEDREWEKLMDTVKEFHADLRAGRSDEKEEETET